VSAFFLTLASQWLRSQAMVTAATNFSHTVASTKAQGHRLVTEGVYQISRHPSYTGFFWWVVGMQLLLGNPVSLPIHVAVTWRFFSNRIFCKSPPFSAPPFQLWAR
jgi:protein-S-isoprenylcysteine O-methyltransferase